MQTQITLALILFSSFVFAAPSPTMIPRASTHRFRTYGLFEGGAEGRANLEAMRLAQHSKEGFERWVIDFSDEKTRAVGAFAPRFQLQYLKADKTGFEGHETVRHPARFIFTFRSLDRNYLNAIKIQSLAHKSHYVQDIVLYPQIEGGDMVMEFVLKDDVQFEPHQPIEKEGRLVLDLKAKSKI